MRICRSCGQSKPLRLFDVTGRNKAGESQYRGVCKFCRSEQQREAYRRKMQDPEQREKLRAQNRARRAREASTLEGRERQLERGRRLSREYYEREMADPSKREERNRKARERRARLKVENPEAYALLRERERERQRKYNSTPAGRRKLIEARRIRDALAREERGVLGTGTPRARVAVLSERVGALPVAPLVRAIEEWLDGQHNTAVRALDIEDRQLRAWRAGEYGAVHFDVADRTLAALGLLWWEVWREGDPGHDRARELFVGKAVAA